MVVGAACGRGLVREWSGSWSGGAGSGHAAAAVRAIGSERDGTGQMAGCPDAGYLGSRVWWWPRGMVQDRAESEVVPRCRPSRSRPDCRHSGPVQRPRKGPHSRTRGATNACEPPQPGLQHDLPAAPCAVDSVRDHRPVVVPARSGQRLVRKPPGRRRGHRDLQQSCDHWVLAVTTSLRGSGLAWAAGHGDGRRPRCRRRRGSR